MMKSVAIGYEAFDAGERSIGTFDATAAAVHELTGSEAAGT
jgi:hypothetical protein